VKRKFFDKFGSKKSYQMIDFPIDELMDEDTCHSYLLRQLHPDGLKCPHCCSEDRYVAKKNTWFDGYKCVCCKRYYTMYTGTAFEKTRQPASKLVLILRGFAKGETTAGLSRELKLDRENLLKLRHRIQDNLFMHLPGEQQQSDQGFEADELFQNAGEKGQQHKDPEDPPRRRANKKRGMEPGRVTAHPSSP
jgi:transposase-like protein